MKPNPTNPFPKNSKCEYPDCDKRMEAIMIGIKFCDSHFQKISYNKLRDKKNYTQKEIRELMKELREYEIHPLKRLL